MSIKNLDAFFNPRRIAVLGASEDKNVLGYHVFRNLIGKGFKGVVFPVNEGSEAIQGVEAYHNINAIPHPIDLAIITLPPDELYTALDDCGQKEVKGVVIATPDFEQKIDNARQLEEQIRTISRIYGFRVLGPDSLGFLRPGKNLNASLFPSIPPKGNIAFISQSGIFSAAFLERAMSKKMGLSYFISLGKKLDIDLSDLVDYLGIDPETRAIILYMTHITDGRKFMTAVRSFASSKPIVVVRPGRYGISSRDALTHAALLAGEDKVYEAAFKRAGAVRVNEMLDLFYITETLAKQHRPKGKRLAIVTNAAGSASMSTDALISMGGKPAILSDETAADMNNILSIRGNISNPVTLDPEASPRDFQAGVTSCLKDNGVDGVLVVYVPHPCRDAKDIAAAVAEAGKSVPDVPLFIVLLGDELVKEARQYLNNTEMPTFVTPEQAVRSFMFMYRYDYNLKLLQETPEVILKDFVPDKDTARYVIEAAITENRQVLHLTEVKDILDAYGIPAVETYRTTCGEDCVRIARKIGYPVVLKIDSEAIFHKMEENGVQLNLRSDEAVREACAFLTKLALSHGDAEASVIVQPMVIKHGYELAIGAKRDPSFGSAILFGIGGDLLGAMGDYTVGLPPLNQTLARRMMEDTKIYQHLNNLPDFHTVLGQIEQILVRFSQLIIDFHHIKEIDINPVIISQKDVISLDAEILLEAGAVVGDRSLKDDLCPPHLCICPYPYKYSINRTLEDGTPCCIRPIQAEDEPLIYALFKSLSDETITYRFGYSLVHLPHEKLVRYCQIDYDRELAFVAVTSDQKKIIGDVRISKMPDLENAELSILVLDDWQGKGIGTILMEYSVGIAKEIGLKSLWMEILKNNSRMLGLGRKFGFKQAYDDEDMVRVVLQL
jgi:acetyltransferase